MTVRFQVSTRHSGRLRTVRVCVYDTLKEMRAAGTRWTKRVEGRKETYRTTVALAQWATWEAVYKSGRTVELPLVGHLRFWRERLFAEIIAHEATHVAMKIYRQDVGETISARPDHAREETFCYLVGDITGKVVDGLRRHRVLK